MYVLVEEAVKVEAARSRGCPTVLYYIWCRVLAVRSSLGSGVDRPIRGSELLYHGAIGLGEQG